MQAEPKAIDPDPRPSAALERAIGERYGLSLAECTPEGLAERLRHRIQERALEGVESYAEYLLYSGDPAAWDGLVETLTRNESRVFGAPADFAPLFELPSDPRWSRFTHPGAGRFRCLSAGSGTGEEAYSLAIALHETRSGNAAFDFEVIGVDLSARAIARARAGAYPASRAASLPPELRERYLVEREGEVVAEPLRRFVRFARSNLCAPGALVPLGEFHLVFARGFLSTLTPEGRAHALANLARALAPGGVLVLGPGESIGEADLALEPIRWCDRHAYERPAEERPSSSTARAEPDPEGERSGALVAHRSALVRGWLRILLEESGASVEEAPDGMRALERAVTGRPRGAYVLELTLPPRGGAWVAERLARLGIAGAERVIYLTPRPPAADPVPRGSFLPLPLSPRDLESALPSFR